MTKEDVANLFKTNCSWKVLIGRSIPDKFDKSKHFWHLKADQHPEK
jgi:hypothetical protein